MSRNFGVCRSAYRTLTASCTMDDKLEKRYQREFIEPYNFEFP